MVKKILSIILWVITGAALVVLFIFARENYLNKPLQAISINPAKEAGFVKKDDLHNDIDRICSNKKIGTVDMITIQNQLQNNPWIESGTFYIDLDGNLNVNFKEYEPKLRVFSKNGPSVYVTHDGNVVPSSPIYTPYVLIASGNFDIRYDSITYQLNDSLSQDKNIINALYWCNAIEKNSFINNCTGQLFCNKRNEFEITVKGIEARVILGDTCDAANKLRRLETFMKQRIDHPETMIMKSINLNYKNQIVCTKQ